MNQANLASAKVGFSENLEIGLLKQGEEEALFEFYREFHERGERIISFWKWRRSPGSPIGPGADIVARYQGKIVGAMGLDPFEHCVGGSRSVVWWHRDTLVSPAMRGKGLVKKLLKRASEDWEMVLAKGSNEIMYKVRKSLGWRDVPNSNYMAVGLRCWPSGETTRKKAVHLVLYLWGRLLIWGHSKERGQCHRVDEFDARYDASAERSIDNGLFKIHKTANYLNWRYVSCPDKEYTIIECEDGKEFGAVVLRLPSESSAEAWIIDMICDLDAMHLSNQLVLAAVEEAKRVRAKRLQVFATLPELRGLFAKLGFVDIKTSPRFTYTVKADHYLVSKVVGLRWHFVHGDSDNELFE